MPGWQSHYSGMPQGIPLQSVVRGALKDDMVDTLDKSIEVTPDMLKTNLLQHMIYSVVRIFAPMM